MKLGVVFPQREATRAAGEVKAYARAVEELGFDHVLVYDHVLNADPAEHPGWAKYTTADAFHEPVTLLAYLAAVSNLELVTGVLVLPQRQAALVAKQAAQLDWLSEGRLRLGVGLGWNELEYEALGADFGSRAALLEEQIEVMRSLWTNPSVRLKTENHSIPGLGLNPRPIQRPIPLWIGSTTAARSIERAARLADGWMPLGVPGTDMDEAVDRFRSAAEDAGRPAASIGIEARIDCRHLDLARVEEDAAYWRDLDVTHISFSTMDAGFANLQEHVEFLAKVHSSVSSALI